MFIKMYAYYMKIHKYNFTSFSNEKLILFYAYIKGGKSYKRKEKKNA